MTDLYSGREQFRPRLKPLPDGMGYPNPVFQHCSKGHQLGDHWSYLYTSYGNRSCRECAGGGGKKRRAKFTLGHFD